MTDQEKKPLHRNAEYTAEYLAEMEKLDGDEEGRRQVWDYMLGSTAIYHGLPVYSSYLPRLLDESSHKFLENVARTSYDIVTKIMQEYLDNPDFRDVFRYDPRMVELICLPRNYDALLPVARVDIFWNEDTDEFMFCEFNSDGSSGMNENYEVTHSIRGTKPYQAFAARHTIHDDIDTHFKGWIDEMLAIYDTYKFKVERPCIAVIDFLENAVTTEFERFGHLLEERGYEFAIYDIRELTFDGEHLIGGKATYGPDNMPIDLAWRRAVSSDITDHWDESQALVEALRAEKVCMMGSFASHIVHDKQIFQALFNPKVKALLTDEENAFVERTIPFTAFLDEGDVDLDAIKAEREKWIIKPPDSYSSQRVFPGRDFSDEEWACVVDEHANGAAGSPFIVQRFIDRYKSEAVPLYNREEDYTAPVQMYNNLFGLFLYNGKFAGLFIRQGPGSIILGVKGGVTAASLWISD